MVSGLNFGMTAFVSIRELGLDDVEVIDINELDETRDEEPSTKD
jgi:hypothetical protein